MSEPKTNEVVVPDEAAAKLEALTKITIVRDPTGKQVGTFVPAALIRDKTRKPAEENR